LAVDTVDHRLELARIADAPAIAAMSCRLIEAGLSPSWPAERVARHIRGADSLVLTAKRCASLIGFAIMQFGETTAHLNLLAVDASSQRRGLGRALLSWLEESAVVAGTFVIELELRASNAAAHAFYAARGYRDRGRVAGYYQRVEDAIQMDKNLSVAPLLPDVSNQPATPWG
jgi:[ribosomal protein S18]-alanine N-acetyltransferase